MTKRSTTPARPSRDETRTPAGGLVWKVLSAGSTILATKVATTAATKGWKVATGRGVPVKKDYDGTRTRDVIAYSALSAALLTGAKAAAERGAAEYYRRSTGHLPQALTEPTKAEKKANKKLEKAKAKAAKKAKQLAS